MGRGIFLLLLIALRAQAAYNDDVGHTALKAELGSATPDGSGIPVGQIEASVQVGADQAWLPESSGAEFSGKVITDMSGAVPGVFSGHATSVASLFYGDSASTSPGIMSIAAYNASHWLGGGFLRTYTGSGVKYQPLASASRVSNHSWVGDAGAYDKDILSRLDWAIDRDEMVQVVGFTGSSTTPLLSSAYNVIAVSRTDSAPTAGAANANPPYTAGRTKPDLVAPADSVSAAAPRVASASALLVQVGHDSTFLSTDTAGTYRTTRSGSRVYNAERVEVVRAALMAGASRYTRNSGSADIKDYRVAPADRTTNGLDRRFGAGQLNIFNSYRVVAAGEQNSSEDQPAKGGLIASLGFDYDPAFGGLSGSNATATYRIPSASGPRQLSAALVWNLSIKGGTSTAFDGTPTFYDLGLRLYDVTNPNNWILVDSSESPAENTENLWRRLDSGKSYALRVIRGAAQAAFKWDYGLAWHVTPIAPLIVDPIVLPDAEGGMAYPVKTLTASGGQGPYAWSVVSGSLPQGMTLSPTGSISGTPTILATYFFSAQVTDANGDTATLALSIRVTGCSACQGGCHVATSF